ncbi:MAG: DUF2961 domain-containing protein, partial [Verrucomicrobiae bacterium]|nr:DUF2961 domain-containing protein [Verrucomicrobiae bacterium]
MRTHWKQLGLTGLATLFMAGTVIAKAVTLKSLLEEMVDREHLARLEDPAYTCRQFSSYSRLSVAPDLPGWFANRDQSYFVRTETTEGREENVMMDAEGPGAIVRWWVTMSGPGSGKGTLRVYLDGARKPTIEGNVFDVMSRGLIVGAPLSDSVSPTTDPLRRGHDLYFPITYNKSCKVTFEREEDGAFYYQMNYRTYESGTRVETFSEKALENAADTLANVQYLLATRDRSVSKAWKHEELTGILKPGKSRSLTLKGPASIREILLNLQAEDRQQALRSTVLQIEFDGNQTVWCPVGDFFGTGYQFRPYSSWYTQATVDGTLGCWWVMPFARTAKVTLTNLGDQTVTLPLGRITTGDWKWDDSSLYFHSTWRQLYQVQTGANGRNIDPPNAQDVNFVTIRGKGKYVGDTLTLYNGGTRWWGEGDEKIWVDGENFPSHFGTGTEDYYGYAWCRPQKFASPFHAQPCGD